MSYELVWRTDQAIGLRLSGSTKEIVLHTDTAAAQFEAAGGKIVVRPFDVQIGRAAVVEDTWGNQYVLLDASKGMLVTDATSNVVGNNV